MKIFLDNIIYIELGELQPVVPPLGVKENYIVPSTKLGKKKKRTSYTPIHKIAEQGQK